MTEVREGGIERADKREKGERGYIERETGKISGCEAKDTVGCSKGAYEWLVRQKEERNKGRESEISERREEERGGGEVEERENKTEGKGRVCV